GLVLEVAHLHVLEARLVSVDGVLERTLHDADGVGEVVEDLRDLDQTVIRTSEAASLSRVEQAREVLRDRALEIRVAVRRAPARRRIGQLLEAREERGHGRDSSERRARL